jgi:3-oxoacyl-[acyl-carrier protein] reductase
MSGIESKVALITGASRGIGRAIGERLGLAGATVAINYRSRRDEAVEVVRAIESAGGRARAFQADVAQVAEIRRLFAQVVAAFGGIDIVVANAGMPFIGVPVVEVTEEDFDRVYGVNNKGSFFVMQEAARHVRDGGRIVDISSSTTFYAAAGMGVHAASKAGSRLIVEVLAAELGSRRITVNSVMPGATRTEFIKDAPQSELDRIAAGSPLGRLGEPDEIADVVAFLVSEQARWVTGQHILANGGAKV